MVPAADIHNSVASGLNCRNHNMATPEIRLHQLCCT